MRFVICCVELSRRLSDKFWFGNKQGGSAFWKADLFEMNQQE